MGTKALILACLFLTGCVTSAPINDPRSVWCETNSPRRPSVAVIEAMSRGELDEFNSYSAKGRSWCGWAP